MDGTHSGVGQECLTGGGGSRVRAVGAGVARLAGREVTRELHRKKRSHTQQAHTRKPCRTPPIDIYVYIYEPHIYTTARIRHVHHTLPTNHTYIHTPSHSRHSHPPDMYPRNEHRATTTNSMDVPRSVGREVKRGFREGSWEDRGGICTHTHTHTHAHTHARTHTHTHTPHTHIRARHARACTQTYTCT